MEQRTLIILAIVGFSVVSLLALSKVEVANANFIPLGNITIYSPTNQTTYNSSFILLNFNILYVTANKSLTCSIDKQPNVTITGLTYSGDEYWQEANGTVHLPKLSDGKHIIQMYTNTSPHDREMRSYSLVTFTINTTKQSPSPKPTIISDFNSTTTIPTLEPTQLPSQAISPLFGFAENPLLSSGAIAIVAVALVVVALVYFKKRKKLINKQSFL